jgi:hypothetical protein
MIMDVEKNISKERACRSKLLMQRRDVGSGEVIRQDVRDVKYLLTDKAVDYVHAVLEGRTTKKKIKGSLKGIQWRHRDGPGYAFDDLDKVARRLARE